MSPQSADARSEREASVLKAVVRAFLASGEPVGSKCIAGSPGCEVSSATVRSVMGELEELGLLAQPHASAGRVPTEQGLRVYLEQVLAERRTAPGGVASGVGLARDLVERGENVPRVLDATSRLLAQLCHCVGVVLHPSLGQTRIRHAYFQRLAGHRVVAVLVGDGGEVSDRVVAVEDDYPQEELDRISRYIVNRFAGRTLLEVRRTLEHELVLSRPAYDEARRQWLELVAAAVAGLLETARVSVDGAAACLDRPDFDHPGRVRELLRAFEEKDRIARLLAGLLERGGVQIRIGSDLAPGAGEAARGLALVAAQYGAPGVALGTLGVLGPTRMPYEKVIEVVDAVARDLGAALLAHYADPH